MRFLDLIFLVFCIHLSIATYNAVGISAYSLQPHSTFLNTMTKGAIIDDSYSQSQVGSSVNTDAGDYIMALFYFVISFGTGIIVIPYTLALMGLTFPFTLYFSMPIYFLYIVGWLQIISRDSYKGKQ